MANRQTTFLIKRSNVPGKVPPASGLTSGELALNTADAILYTSGSTANQILPIGWDRLSTLSGGTVSGATNFISGLTANTIYTDYIDFNIAATPIQPTLGRISWNSTDRTLDLGNGDGDSILQIGQETVYPPVFNSDSINLVEGTLVMIDPNQIAQGNDVRVVRAITDGTYPSQYLVGILTEDILQGQLGLATWFGKVRNLNENTLEANGIKPTGETWSEGAVLYPNPLVAGGLTITPPQAPNINGTIAVVTAVNGVNITLLVRPTLTFTLTELTNVRTTGLTDGDILVYNSGDTVWESTKTLRGNYTISGNTNQIGSFNISGHTTGCTLSVTGKTCINGDLDVVGDVVVVGDLVYDGDLIVTGGTVVQNGFTANTITISNTPTLNNNLTQILGRNETTGVVEYRQVNTIGNNYTYVSGSTYSALTTDNVIGVDSSISATTIYLPNSVTSGRLRYDVKDIGLNSYINNITFIANGTDTIIGVENTQTLILDADGGAIILFNTGTGTWLQM